MCARERVGAGGLSVELGAISGARSRGVGSFAGERAGRVCSGGRHEGKGFAFVFCDLPSWISVSAIRTLWFVITCTITAGRFWLTLLHGGFTHECDSIWFITWCWEHTGSPVSLSLLPIPFVWGPLGGGEVGPASFVRRFPLKERLNESLRDLVRRVGEGDPFVRLTAQRSSLALAKTNQTATRLRALGAVNVEVMSEAGLSQQELRRLSQIPQRSELPFPKRNQHGPNAALERVRVQPPGFCRADGAVSRKANTGLSETDLIVRGSRLSLQSLARR